ncbi:MAG: hypothetical protein ABIF09_03980 [Gemmatimonadota bacterium]
MASKLSLFLVELKRRKVYRVATVYVVVGAGIIGLGEAALPSNIWEGIQIPVGIIVLIGLPIALILAWAYELKPEESRLGEPPAQEPPPTPGTAGPIEITGQAKRKSIVVLPFDNMSPDPGDAYFSDGLTEEIITHLSFIRSLRVISRNSAMALKGTDKSTRVIADELDVQYVLEGSVRKAGTNLLITAQLIDGPDDAHLWADKYAGTFDDVFEIQEKVARSIVDALKIELTSEEGQRIADRPIEDLRAYECYLKATAGIYGFTEESISEALRHLHLALNTVGDNAILYSGLALTHFSLMNVGVRIEENRAKAFEAVQKALALDPEIPKARALLGILTMTYSGTLEDVKEGARHLKLALEADPDDVQALWGMIVICLYVGRPQDAYPLARRLRGLDPLDGYALWPLPAVFLFDGKYDVALREFRKLHEMDREHPGWLAWYALALAYNEEVDEAAALIEPCARAHPNEVHTKLALIQIRALRGDKQGVLRELDGPFYEWSRERAWATRVAAAFALLGEKKEALDWLEHAVNHGFINYPLLSEGDPWLENIRGEERFKELMVGVKREWETFEV